MNTTKADLIHTIHQQTRYPTLQVYETVHQLMQVIGERLGSGEEIQIRGFGTLYTKEYKPRPARNPRNGDPYQVPARIGVKFRVAPGLRQRVEGK